MFSSVCLCAKFWWLHPCKTCWTFSIRCNLQRIYCIITNIRESLGGSRWILKVSHYRCLFTEAVFLPPILNALVGCVNSYEGAKGKQTLNAAKFVYTVCSGMICAWRHGRLTFSSLIGGLNSLRSMNSVGQVQDKSHTTSICLVEQEDSLAQGKDWKMDSRCYGRRRCCIIVFYLWFNDPFYLLPPPPHLTHTAWITLRVSRYKMRFPNYTRWWWW